MSTYRRELGKEGEEKAVEFLEKNGYNILDKNFRTRFGEIDIVANEGNYIVFIEVKTRKSLEFGSPQLSVNYHKKNKLAKLALQYIKSKCQQTKNIRFDVVAITKNNIELIKNAFQPHANFFY
ncbi:MAG: YraN family protein [Elusimicrobiota bacterium]|nr:YraN family protein [Elusimicrobiota bacterium]